MKVKEEIRIVGWDDAPFPKRGKGKIPVIGTIFRGGSFLDGVLRVDVEIDGFDATEAIAKAINNCKHKDLRVIMLDGITFAGFNVVDIKELHEKTKLPVIAVTRKKPNMKRFLNAMKNLPGFEIRYQAVKNAGEFGKIKISPRGKDVYFQKVGITEGEAKEIIRISATRSLIPEPIRVAHLIASAIMKGESVGRP